MVQFNPAIDKTGDPSYLSLSRDTSNPLAMPAREGRPAQPVLPAASAPPPVPVLNVPIAANTTFEALFKGLAQGIDIGAKGLYGQITENIDEQARKKFRDIQSAEFGVGQATDLGEARVPPTGATGDNTYGPDARAEGTAEGGSMSILSGPQKTQGRGLPPGAQGIVNRIIGLDDLHKNGQLSQSYYLSVMNAEVSKLKANYPGFEKEVEHITKNILGVDPANALRASLMADMDARAKSMQAGASAELKELVAHSKYLPPTFMDNYRAGKATIWDARKIYGQRMSAEYDIEQEKATRTNDKEENIYRTEISFSKQARDRVVTVLNNNTMSPEAQQIIESWKKGIAPTPEQHSMIMQNLRDRDLKLDKDLAAIANGIDPDTGQLNLDRRGGSPSTYIDKEKIKSISEQAKAPSNILRDFIGAKDYSLAGQFAEITRLLEDKGMKDFQVNFPAIAKWGLLNKNAGPNVAPLILNLANPGGPTLLNQLTSTMQKFMHFDTVSNPDPPAQADQITKAMPSLETPKEKAGFINQDVNTNAAILNGTIPADPQHTAQVAKSVFHPNNKIFDLVSPTDYIDIYSKYTSPAVNKRMEALKDSDPLTYNRFLKWSVDNSPTAIMYEMRTLAKSMQSDYKYTLDFNLETHLLEVKSKEPVTKVQRAQKFTVPPYVDASVQNVNRVLSNLSTILEGGKRNVNDELQRIFAGMGVNFDIQAGKQ